jgi:hypothetical protein
MLIGLDHSVPVKDFSGAGVDPQKKEPLIAQGRGDTSKVALGISLSSMLEDLNRNDISEQTIGPIGAKVSHKDRERPLRTPRDESSYRLWRDVDAVEIRTGINERKVVAAVSAAYVKPSIVP